MLKFKFNFPEDRTELEELYAKTLAELAVEQYTQEEVEALIKYLEDKEKKKQK